MSFRHQLSMPDLKGQSGQIALVVLLVMIIMLTLGVSVAQRGLLDVKFSQQEEETSRAFQAAETGAEQSLLSLDASSGEVSSGVLYTSTVTDGGTGSEGYATGQPVEPGDTLVIELAGDSSNPNSINIHFYDQDTSPCDVATNTPPAIEVQLVSQTGPDTSTTRSAIDIDTSGRSNGFDPTSIDVHGFSGKTFCAQKNINLNPNSKELRIRPLYVATNIGIEPNGPGTLPTQFRLIRSTGQTDSGITRAVEIQRTNPQAPSIFDYSLFSGTEISK